MALVGPSQRAAQYMGSTGIAALTDGQWNNLTSASFQNVAAAVGTTLPAGLVLVEVSVIPDSGSAACHVRLYGSEHTPGAADATTNFPYVPAGGALTLPTLGVAQSTSGLPATGVSIYKAAGATGRIITLWDPA